MRADALRNRQRILEAAETVFAERGVAASTEDVAELAGVAIGTVFRHFPTKPDLLRAILKNLLARLASEASALAGSGDDALFEFFRRLVDESAAKKAVVDLLGDTASGVGDALQQLRDAVGVLLAAAQDSGVVRGDVGLDEVMALLTATSQGALRGGWDTSLRRRTLEIVFAGLRH